MALPKLIIFCFINFVALASCEQSVIQLFFQQPRIKQIHSTSETNFGSWGEWAVCPPKTFVTGFQLKVEPKNSLIDDTGLNGIRLFCGEPLLDTSEAVSIPEEIIWHNVTSSVGVFGFWSQIYNCTTHAVGFNLEVVPDRGNYLDDKGATNMKLICADGEMIEGYNNNGNQHTFDGAVYTGVQKCDLNYAVCGIRTQVEGYQFAGDDTALNNVKMMCCPL